MESALERASRLVDGEDGLREVVVRADVLAEWEDEDFAILLSAFRWFADNPESGLYVRSCPSRAWIPSGSRSPE